MWRGRDAAGTRCFRVFQGIGGGLLAPVGTTMLFRAYSPGERVRAARVLVLPTSIAPALGPLLGGILVDCRCVRARAPRARGGPVRPSRLRSRGARARRPDVCALQRCRTRLVVAGDPRLARRRCTAHRPTGGLRAARTSPAAAVAIARTASLRPGERDRRLDTCRVLRAALRRAALPSGEPRALCVPVGAHDVPGGDRPSGGLATDLACVSPSRPPQARDRRLRRSGSDRCGSPWLPVAESSGCSARSCC